jgi:ATP-binding cassette subfamily C (CFTR/MRP) protein 10
MLQVGALFITLFQTVAQAALVSFNSLWMVPAFVPVLLLFYLVARYFRNSSREMQRLNSTSGSPIYAAFTEALNGACSIQATGSQQRFRRANLKLMNHNQQAAFLVAVASKWLSVRMEALCTMLLTLTAVLAVYEATESGHRSTKAAAYAGLALSAAPALTDMLNFLLQSYTAHPSPAGSPPPSPCDDLPVISLSSAV